MCLNADADEIQLFSFWGLMNLLLKQQLDVVEENMAICDGGADQLFSAERLRQIIDPRHSN